VYDLNDSHVTQENKVLVKFSVLNDNDNECHRLLGCDSFYSTLTYQMCSSETTLHCLIFYSLLC